MKHRGCLVGWSVVHNKPDRTIVRIGYVEHGKLVIERELLGEEGEEYLREHPAEVNEILRLEGIVQ